MGFVSRFRSFFSARYVGWLKWHVHQAVFQHPELFEEPSVLSRIVSYRKDDILRSLSEVYPEFQHRTLSYSQEGEDIILARMLSNVQSGFYVDVGAHHPFRFSNTYLFYLRGWRGINIDASPGSMALFDRYRPRDINIEALVGEGDELVKLYVFDEPALNTASEAVMRDRLVNAPAYKFTRELDLPSRRLTSILSSSLPENTQITFLTIDVEGLELEILESNDWDRFRPRIILVEQLNCDLSQAGLHPTTSFLARKRYSLVYKTLNTAFFVSDSPC
jgi:FkbM family methyltransferase